VNERTKKSRDILKGRVAAARASAKAHGCYAKFRSKYIVMMRENYGFNALFGIGRISKKRINY
jgi:hypothetical protein